MLLSACSDDTSAPSNGAVLADAAVAPDVPTCSVPERPYGMTVGATFPRAALTDCTSEESYALYDDPEFCANQVTVLFLTAGWCGTCQAESASIERDINQRFAGRPVRFIQVVIENPDRTAGTAEFCRTWQQRYHLTNRMTIDPSGTVRRFAGGTLPGIVIFDNVGRIRYVGHGAALATWRYQIEALLDGEATTP